THCEHTKYLCKVSRHPVVGSIRRKGKHHPPIGPTGFLSQQLRPPFRAQQVAKTVAKIQQFSQTPNFSGKICEVRKEKVMERVVWREEGAK
ncbi:MAG: hypothetical protein IJP82_02140, partial [Bacteroidaceae bacterium]|nr:hypothetical protein [Bacteroidaceae bacterium]